MIVKSDVIEKLQVISKENIGFDSMDKDMNFFELGVDSIKAIVFINCVEDEYNIELSPTQLFETPTISELAQFIVESRDIPQNLIEPLKQAPYYSLSSAQRRMYFIHRVNPNSIAYNLPFILHIKGNLPIKKIKNIFQQLLDRHESLRTSFHMIDEIAVQKINESAVLDFEQIDWMEEVDYKEKIKGLVVPFDLTKESLLRVKVIKIALNQFILFIDMHHIISDGTSFGLLLTEFTNLYQGKSLEPLHVQYKDFAHWQTEMLASEFMKEQESYWLKTFKGEIPQLEFPIDKKRPLIQRFEGKTITFDFNSILTNQLKEIAKENGTTLYNVLISIYSILLYKYTSKKDIIIGTPVLGRNKSELHNLIGMFVNTLPIRNKIDDTQTFLSFLKEVKQITLSAFNHWDYQFDTLVERLGVNKDYSQNPIFTTIFALQNMEFTIPKIEGLQIEWLKQESGTSKFDFSLLAYEGKENLQFELEYNTDLLLASTMERFATHYTNIAKAVAFNTGIKITDISMMSEDETKFMLKHFIKGNKHYNGKLNVVEIFENKVQNFADYPALYFDNSYISYCELNRKVNQLARYLLKMGVKKGDIVAVAAMQSADFITGILAILKVGCAFLPIDINYPGERISFMLQDCKVFFVLTDQDIEFQHKVLTDQKIISLKEQLTELDTNLDLPIFLEDSAYIIYTSGTMGNPKGTVIQHKALLNLCKWHINYYKITSKDRSTKYAGVGFDATIWEIFPYLLVGACIYIVDEESKLNIEKLHSFFQGHQITISYLPTIVSEEFMRLEAPSYLKKLLTGGEKLKYFHQNHYEVYNNYGPTENAVVTTSYRLKQEDENIPIGKPIYNTQVYIMNSAGQLQPMNVVGEICISGNSIALGYLNQEQLNSEKFVNHPYKKNEKLYKTGDLGRWRLDGNIEFCGRIDNQVKIRGYRIELDEIEQQLLKHPKVKKAAVDVKYVGANSWICAYYVGSNKNLTDELKRYLQHVLPSYMMPHFFTELKEIIINQNGKVDKKALPIPEVNSQSIDILLPRNNVEKELLCIWKEVFHFDNIGVNNDFFELGGHSILMMKIVAKIKKSFDFDLSLNEFIKNNSIENIAKIIESCEGINKIQYKPIVASTNEMNVAFPLTEVQKAYLLGRDPSFELGGKATHGYFEFEMKANIPLFQATFQQLINRHSMLRTIILPEGCQKVVTSECTYTIEVIDMETEKQEDIQEYILRQRDNMSEEVFDTTVWPLFHIKAIKLKQDLYYFLVGFDPIIADTSSLRILVSEFQKIYRDPKKDLKELKFNFHDYMLSYAELQKDGIYQKDKKFWLNKLEDFPTYPMLPLKVRPGEILNPKFSKFQVKLEKSKWSKLKNLASENGVTASALLCTIYAEVLAYWSNQPHMALNLTVFNRYPFHEDVYNIVGDFTSVILLDLNLEEKKLFWDKVKSLQNILFESLEHRHYDGVKLIREIAKLHNMGTSPVMPIIFTCILNENANETGFDIDFSKVKNIITRTSQAFIDHQVMEVNDELIINWDYVEQLFEYDMINSMFLQFVGRLNNLCDKEEELSELEHSVEEVYHLYNNTKVEFSLKTLQENFLKTVEKYPENSAIIFENQSITYKELDYKSNQVARFLINNHIKRQDYVGVVGARCPETIINILGILKAGAAYVPVLPDYPDERIKYIINNSNCKMLLTPDVYEKKDIKQLKGDTIPIEYEISDIAYVIYTSGSTGEPKGVVITQSAVVNTILDINDKFHVNENDKILGLSSLCFDLSVYDIFGTLLSGAALVIVHDQRDTDEIEDILEKQQITIWNSVPSIMELFLNSVDEYKNDTLRLTLLSGDWISMNLPNKIQQHFNNAMNISLGGATEAAIWSIYYTIQEVCKEWKSIPYGIPLANQKFYILNYEGKLCPIGVEGELFIGGAGLSVGYLNDEQKTNASFIAHKELGKLYKTGDYGIFHKEGYIEFTGRKDFQVKIRGYRIELGEIEKVLTDFSQITNSVVINYKDENDNQEICAYYVAKVDIDYSVMKQFLTKKLTHYMIPNYFMRIDTIPLTANGKLDYKKLPKPIRLIEKDVAECEFTNEMEQKLSLLCKEELGLNFIGKNDNFFELGIDSLRMMQIRTRIRKDFNVDITFREFIEQNNISLLAALVARKDKKQEISYPKIIPDSENLYQEFPLTDVQMAYLMGRKNQFEMGGISTHGYSEIETRLDIKRLNAALVKLIQHQPMLRAIILENGKQKILKDIPDYIIQYTDLSENSEEEKTKWINKERERMSHDIFQTDKWPLFEFKAFKLSENINYLFVGFDLLIADGASMQIFIRELMEFYNGRELMIDESQFTFRDYIIASKEYEHSEVYKKDKEFWLNQIQNFPAAPELPMLKSPSKITKPQFKRCSKWYTTKEWELLKQKAKEHKVTPSALLCTAYAEALAKWTNQPRMAINSTVFTRYPFHEKVNEIIGDFTSVMLLDIHLDKEKSFFERAKNVQSVLIEALEHRHYDGIQFIREISRKKNLGTKAIMPIVFTSLLFNEKNTKSSDVWKELGEMKLAISQTSQVFIDHQVMEMNDGLSLTWDYVEELFNHEMIVEMFDYYINIIDSVIYDLEINDNVISKSTELIKYNETRKKIPQMTLHGMFLEQVIRNPDNIAVIYYDKSITYQELDKKSNQIANYLYKLGIGKGDLVVILAKRCINTIANILGILKVGGAYIPIDPEYPEKRKKTIIEDSRCKLVLYPDTFEVEKIYDLPNTYEAELSIFDEAAYVIYTSGSTGKPKGVLISHKAVTNTIIDINRRFHVTEKDNIIGLSSMCFDLSVYDIFGALGVGATLVLIKDQRDVLDVNRILIEKEITIWNSVPAIMEMLVNHLEGSNMESQDYWSTSSKIVALKYPMRLTLLSGDWIPTTLPNKIKDSFIGVEVISLGGATEAAIWSIYHEIEDKDCQLKSIPYGKPLSNQMFYVLNHRMEMSPVDVPGELYIGGEGLAEEYLFDEPKTNSAFITHHQFGRIYRTGDFGVFRKTGEIEFLGRKDLQIKIRGYRVELGEIESCLMEHKDVRSAVVVDYVNDKGIKYLCAYVVANKKAIDEELKESIKDRLPDYMIPSNIIVLDHMPLTANGKVDRNKLEKPHEIVCLDYKEPSNETENMIQKIWQKSLNLSRISVDDNFFEIGGNSISMVQITNEINKEFSIEMNFSEFLERNTIEKLGELVLEHSESNQAKYEICEPNKEELYEPFPLTEIQMAYLLGRNDLFELGGTSTHGYSEIVTKLDIVKLNGGLQTLIERHPMLRTVIYPEGVQKILSKVPLYHIEIVDLCHLNEQEQKVCIKKERDRMSHYIFKTDEWPLFEFKALKIREGTHYLLIGFDLLIADGASMLFMGKELLKYYYEPNYVFTSLEFTFRDYMIALINFKNTATYHNDKRFWLSKLENFPNAPALPMIEEPARILKPHFKHLSRTIDRTAWNEIKSQCSKHKITPSAFLCTAFASILSYWSNQEDLALNVTVFNRFPFHPDVNHIIGDFTSVLPLDITIDIHQSIWNDAVKVQKNLLDALQHRHYDGVEFIRELVRYRGTSAKNFLPIVFTSMLLGDEIGKNDEQLSLGEEKTRVTQTSQVYLDHQVMEQNGNLIISWDYVEELFDESVMTVLFSNFIELAHKGNNTERKEVLTLQKEVCQIWNKYNQTSLDLQKGTLQELFMKQVEKTPDKIAVIEGTLSITYKQLNEKSNQVARSLLNQGIQRSDKVGVLVKRSMNTLINICGILKAGAAYVPIDPEHPEDRQKYIIKNSDCKRLINSDFYEKEAHYCSNAPLDMEYYEDDIAYIIYTSGSTGNPKGVVINHSAAVNTIMDMNQKFDINEKDTFIGLSSMCFDLSVYDIFGALSSGATLVMVKDQRDFLEIYNIIENNKITVWNSVPSTMDLVIDYINNDKKEEYGYWQIGSSINSIQFLDHNLRLIMLSGDWIPLNLPEKIGKIFGNLEIISLGGATEASIWSIYYPIDHMDNEWKSIPYGIPLSNQQIYVLNYNMDLCACDVAGEIYIGGKGIARGYIKEQEKTNQSFIIHKTLGRIYKTGDFGRMKQEGYIEFLGRKDHQVKIKGYRIELGEIELNLLNNVHISNTVVVDQQDEYGNKYLCAYFTSDEELDIEEIRKQLIDKLPEYMIPRTMIQVSQIPLTSNGKIDRKTLINLNVAKKIADTYIEPKSNIERLITNIWTQILDQDKISIKDNLFELGANSSNIISFAANLNLSLGIKIPLELIFKQPSIKDISVYVENADNKNAMVCTLLNEKLDNKIYCFPPISTFGAVYKDLAALEKEYSLYSFDYMEREDIIEAYVEQIREIQEHGPYTLLGQSAGGNIAFEVAKRLERDGERVADIFMLDTYHVSADMDSDESERESNKKLLIIDAIHSISNAFDKTALSYLETRISHYLDLLISNHITGIIKANIHFIISENDAELKQAMRADMLKWKNHTSGSFKVYHGKGSHDRMLSGENLLKNYNIIHTIFEN